MRSHARGFQRAYPWAFGGATFIAYVVLSEIYGEPTLAEWSHEFLSNVVDVAAISVGFIMATMGIIFTINDRESIKHLKESGTYDDLIGYMASAAVSSLSFALFSIMANAGMLINIGLNKHKHIHILTVGGWLALAIFAVSAEYRALDFFVAVLKFKEKKKPRMGSNPTDL